MVYRLTLLYVAFVEQSYFFWWFFFLKKVVRYMKIAVRRWGYLGGGWKSQRIRQRGYVYLCFSLNWALLGCPEGGVGGLVNLHWGIDRRAGGGRKKKTASTILRERKEKTGTRKFLRPSFRPSKRFIYQITVLQQRTNKRTGVAFLVQSTDRVIYDKNYFGGESR